MQKKQLLMVELIGILTFVLFVAIVYFLAAKSPKTEEPTPNKQVSFEEIARIASNIQYEYFGYNDKTMSFDDALSAVSDYLENQTDYKKEEAESARSRMFALMEEMSSLLNKIEEYSHQNQ